MNRVKRTSKLYEEARPEIDMVRAIERQSRRTRRAATAVREAHTAMRVAELKTLSLKKLRALASRAGIPGRSKMDKDQLVNRLLEI